MDSFILGENIPVVYINAASFPDGIVDAHKSLHSVVPFNEDRRYFGISRPEPEANGEIIYRAAAEILPSDDFPDLEKMTIKGGSYNSFYIKDYRENIDAIGESFDLLTAQAEVDPEGYCIEWYIGDDDVKCMVRNNDKDYPVSE